MHKIKTRVTNLLDSNGVPYRILPHSKPVFTVEDAANQRGVILGEMVKSILLRERKSDRYVMACVCGADRLDPQAVRRVLSGDWRRLSFATEAEIKDITGFVQGSVAPLCLPFTVPVIFDVGIAGKEKVNISSGDPLAGLELGGIDLINLANAKIAPIKRA